MANMIVTLKIMPNSPESDLDFIKEEALRHINEFAGKGEIKAEVVPFAFGLKSLTLIFVMDENLGSTDQLEQDIKSIKDVNSVEVTDMRRAIG